MVSGELGLEKELDGYAGFDRYIRWKGLILVVNKV